MSTNARLAGESAKGPPRRSSPIDLPVAIRGGSAGFSLLLIGGLLAPLAGLAVPALGGAFLTLTAVLAFLVAARKIGRSSVPQLHGAVAAVLAYALVLPLLLPFETTRNVPQILYTLATAISVGASTAWIQSKREGL